MHGQTGSPLPHSSSLLLDQGRRMTNPFFDHPILNSPYEYPRRHW